MFFAFFFLIVGLSSIILQSEFSKQKMHPPTPHPLTHSPHPAQPSHFHYALNKELRV